jgi:hypothetical protein
MGVNGNLFDPSLAQTGTITLAYSYIGSNGCANSASQVVLVDLCTGNSEETLDTEVRLFPNPASDKLQLMMYGSAFPCVVSIYNTQGQQIDNYTCNKNKMTIDVEAYPAGIYFVSIKRKTTTISVKFIKN